MRTYRFRHLLLLFLLPLLICSCIRTCYDPLSLREANLLMDLARLHPCEITALELNLEQIVHMALERNLEGRVKALDVAIQTELATGEKLRMLPNLIAVIDTSGRDRNTGSASQSLIPNIPPAPPSISSEQHQERNELNFMINLLDFGLSFFRSRQERNKAHIAQQEYVRTQQNLVLEITKQYWRAQAALKAMRGAARLISFAQEHAERLKKEIESQLTSKIAGLQSQNDLLEMKLSLMAYKREYEQALLALANAMALPPCISLSLIEEPLVLDHATLSPIELQDRPSLQYQALTHRPELYGNDLEEKVMIDEINAAFLQMGPGVELSTRAQYDSNKFLLFNYWRQAGLRIIWNLLAIPRFHAAKNVGALRQQQVRVNRMALTVGILTQLEVALMLHHEYLLEFELRHERALVRAEMAQAAAKEAAIGRLNEAQAIRLEADALFALAEALASYAQLRSSLEQINNVSGMPRLYGQ